MLLSLLKAKRVPGAARRHTVVAAHVHVRCCCADGELRAPGHEVMRKLWGAKDKLGLRVHGLVVGSPEKKRADPAVLRSLCSSVLPNGRSEVLVAEFSSWASVQVSAVVGVLVVACR